MLSEGHCEPCEGGGPPLDDAEVERLLKDVPAWRLGEGRITRAWRFDDFATAKGFVDRVAALAESEGHHPDILLHDWNRVRLSLWTHAIGGLSLNDFILAAKIDGL